MIADSVDKEFLILLCFSGNLPTKMRKGRIDTLYDVYESHKFIISVNLISLTNHIV